MIAIIEPTGISVRRGKVQLRLSFYLEPGDARYDEHHVQVSVIPPEGYLGEVDDEGNATDMDAYNEWLESLPKVWQNNPFHNHMERVSPDVEDAEIADLLRDGLVKFYAAWSRGEQEWVEYLKSGAWKHRGREKRGDESPENLNRCALKGLDIAARAKFFEHRGRR